MIEKNEIDISIESCFRHFEQSFNRVKYFSCIMDNLDVEHLPCKWIIRKGGGLGYGMDEPDQSQRQYLFDGCRHFMQRYLVRDCIESFALCLDELLLVLLLHGKTVKAKQTLVDALSEQEKERLSDFQTSGLFGKIEKLENQFCLKLLTEQKQIVTSLKDIRNCFAHSNGTVRPVDGQRAPNKKRKFSWLALTAFGVGTASGKEFEIEFEKPFEEETTIMVKVESHSKLFAPGEMLSFSSAETYEIGLSLQQVARKLIEVLRHSMN